MKILLPFFCFFFFVFTNTHAQIVVKMERESDLFKVPCKINGLALSFIFDTGASDVSISLSEALFMLKNGYLSAEEIKGTQNYQTASGEIHEGMTLLLKEIEFQGIKIYNVSATVILDLKAPLLFGQSAIRKLGEFQFDPNNGILTILNGSKNYNFASSSASSINPNTSKTYTKIELYNIGYPYFKDGNFKKSFEAFSLYTQIYADDPFGFYMSGKSLWATDSTLAKGLANFYFDKTIELAQSDITKYRNQLIGSYKYFIVYSVFIKDKQKALSYCDRVFELDATDQEIINNKSTIERMEF